MSEVPPWGSNRELDLEGARSALEEAFPDLESGDVQALGSGWDFDTFGIDLQWVARFPRRAEVVPAMETEYHMMPTLATELAPLGIEVPQVYGIGGPTATFPYPFLVQRRLWGLSLDSVGPSRFAIRLAPHLGQALSVVHSLVPPSGMQRAQGDEDKWLAETVAAVAELSPALRSRVPRAIEWIEGHPALPPPYPGPPRLLHNDLSPGHVRVARTGLGVLGILDWSDVASGDPARDFAILYSWGGPDVLKHMLPGYTLDLDDGFVERVVFMARLGSLTWLREVEMRGGKDVEPPIAWTLNAFSGE